MRSQAKSCRRLLSRRRQRQTSQAHAAIELGPSNRDHTRAQVGRLTRQAACRRSFGISFARSFLRTSDHGTARTSSEKTQEPQIDAIKSGFRLRSLLIPAEVVEPAEAAAESQLLRAPPLWQDAAASLMTPKFNNVAFRQHRSLAQKNRFDGRRIGRLNSS